MKYDQSIEVTKEKYLKIINVFSGIVAHREENGRYFIKNWYSKYSEQIKKYIA